MNEKFLSRGKRKDNGEWITGYYVKIPNKADKLNKWRHIIFDLDGNAEYIIPETVGRCADLTDKNGKLMFEGDICKFTNYKTSYPLTYIGVIKISADFESKDYSANLLGLKSYDFEVVGNIHDNPELIGGTE